MTQNELMPGSEDFFFKKGKVGCLLCHGFTGTPAELRELGEFLAEKGITVKGPRLSGHCTNVKDMIKTRASDWYADYIKAYNDLAEYCDEIFVGGLSLGGVLTLKFAAEHNVAGIISLATPIKTPFFESLILPIGALLLKNRAIKKSKEDLALQEKMNNISYDKNPIAPANSLFKLVRSVRKKLFEIKEPILIIQGLQDVKWIIKSSKIIQKAVSSEIMEVLYLKNSPHCLTLGPDKDKVHIEVYNFIKSNSKKI